MKANNSNLLTYKVTYIEDGKLVEIPCATYADTEMFKDRVTVWSYRTPLIGGAKRWEVITSR